VSFLTVGFGDFVPTKTAAKVLLFPFSLVGESDRAIGGAELNVHTGIALLGSMIQMLAQFFSARNAERKVSMAAEPSLWEQSAHSRSCQAWFRAQSENEREATKDREASPSDLAAEIEFLERLQSRRDFVEQVRGLALSLTGFLVFWFIGATIFCVIEVSKCVIAITVSRDHELIRPFDRIGHMASACISATCSSSPLVLVTSTLTPLAEEVSLSAIYT
jgi:potassium channel subfamily K, other eukaryote